MCEYGYICQTYRLLLEHSKMYILFQGKLSLLHPFDDPRHGLGQGRIDQERGRGRGGEPRGTCCRAAVTASPQVRGRMWRRSDGATTSSVRVPPPMRKQLHLCPQQRHWAQFSRSCKQRDQDLLQDFDPRIDAHSSTHIHIQFFSGIAVMDIR